LRLDAHRLRIYERFIYFRKIQRRDVAQDFARSLFGQPPIVSIAENMGNDSLSVINNGEPVAQALNA
jgi:hypothetical protein